MKKIKRTICLLLAVIMIAATVGQPVTVRAAAGLPYYIRINRRQNCVTVYKQDEKGKYTIPVKAMTCSTGLNNATPLGTFTLSNKYRWHQLMGGVYSQYCSRIHGGVLFHSVFYRGTNPNQLYYNAFNQLGQAASHGCIRLNVADAKWIYDNCPSGTKVNIYDGKNPGPLGKPKPVRINVNSANRGWDPTDPNPKNPWRKMKPTISGAEDITVERCGKKPDFKKGVTATDFRGKQLKVVKVSGKYNLKKAGNYKITYSAKDYIGNETAKTITLTVKDTKNPVVTVKEKRMVLRKKLSEKKLLSTLKSNVTVSDSGEELSAKYVTLQAKTLTKALSKGKNGTYKVVVYAKDRSGNVSKKKAFSVKVILPKPEKPTKPTKPTEPTEPTTPTEPTNPTEPTTPTEPTNPTEPTTPTEPAPQETSTNQPQAGKFINYKE